MIVLGLGIDDLARGFESKIFFDIIGDGVFAKTMEDFGAVKANGFDFHEVVVGRWLKVAFVKKHALGWAFLVVYEFGGGHKFSDTMNYIHGYKL